MTEIKEGVQVRYVGPSEGFKGERRVIAVLGSTAEVAIDLEADVIRGRTATGKVSQAVSKRSTKSCIYPLWALEVA